MLYQKFANTILLYHLAQLREEFHWKYEVCSNFPRQTEFRTIKLSYTAILGNSAPEIAGSNPGRRLTKD